MTRIIVLTSRREHTGFKYLQNLLRQLPVNAVYVDGPLYDAQEVLVRGHVAYSGKRMGAARATHATLKWASNRWPKENILFLEDDVLPAVEGLLERVEGLEVTGSNALLCLCDQGELEEGTEPGVYPRSPLGADEDGWWGNQALLFDPEVLRWLVEQDWFSRELEESEQIQAYKNCWKDDASDASDVRLGLLVGSHPTRNTIGVHVPSLFYHVGEDSLRYPGGSILSTRNVAGLKGYREFSRAFAQGHLDYLVKEAEDFRGIEIL